MKAKYVSAIDFFPFLEELLAQGKKVCFTVTGTSMTPWIIHGRDSVELVSAEAASLKKGEIILFQPFAGKYVLHRITKIVPGGFITTGDGNLRRDGFVPKEAVIAKAVAIHRKGRIIECSSWVWKLIFRIWMILFPIRKYLLKLVGSVAKIKNKIVDKGL